MATVTLTDRMVSSPGFNRSGYVHSYQCGGTVNLGDVVYLNSSNKVLAAIATAQGTSRAIGIVVGISSQFAETSQATNGWVDVCEHGPVDLGPLTADLTSGQQIWVSGSAAGEMVDTAPTPNAWDWIIGHAVGPNTIFVAPGQTTPASV